MRAVIVREHGGLEALRHETLPDPEPGSGEVCVEVRACGINHLDLWVRKGVPGHAFPLPLIPGNDPTGVVASVGEGVDDIEVGAEVIVAPGVSCGHCAACLSGRDHHCRRYQILGEGRHGGCAERISVPRANIVKKPASLSFEDAAAVGIPFLTAWQMVVGRAEVKPGETVLVQAAGSGVGTAAVQIAKLLGATVIGTASRPKKLDGARALGADVVIDYTKESVPARVKEITGGRGVDVVIEHVGEATWPGSLRALGWQGRLVTCGATTGGKAGLNLHHLFFKSLSILGSTMGSKGDFYTVVDHVAAGRMKTVVDRVMPLSELREAHQLLEAREIFGKIVIAP